MRLTADTDSFGSIHRAKGYTFDGTYIPTSYVDLTQFDDCFIVPISLPANLHFYYGEQGKIYSTAFVVGSQKFRSLEEIRQVLSAPGMHYVLYVQEHDACFLLRWYTYSENTMEYDRSVLRKTGTMDLGDYPHECPKCTAPAYIGLIDVDCSRKCQ